MTHQELKQAVTYILIGGLSNAIGYTAYVLLTFAGLTPKTAMTLLYIIVASLNFFGNKKITFSYQGKTIGSGFRYLIAQLIGYLINLAILMVFSDILGYNHLFIQLGAVLTVAVFLFFSQKFFVFRRVM